MLPHLPGVPHLHVNRPLAMDEIDDKAKLCDPVRWWSYPDDMLDDSLYVLDVSLHLIDGLIQTDV